MLEYRPKDLITCNDYLMDSYLENGSLEMDLYLRTGALELVQVNYVRKYSVCIWMIINPNPTLFFRTC